MKSYLTIALFFLFCMMNTMQSQIIYNKEKPLSYGSSELNSLSQIPEIEYQVGTNGNLAASELGIIVKQKALLEKKGDIYIARVKIKVAARKLGNISLNFKDVKLKNGAHCYVYTEDYKIVAGAVYEKSINGYLNIMNIPANELILEVVFSNEKDYDLTLNSVSYISLFGKSIKDNDKEQLMETYAGCDSCKTYGTVDRINNVTNYTTDCGWLGAGYPEIFEMSKLYGVNSFQYSASRASCLVMSPYCSSTPNYIGNGGTLINFPYEDCNDPEDCGHGFIIGMTHVGTFGTIVVEYQNQSFMDNVLIRFNSHHQYGTPWHLKETNCVASHANFLKWRSTINFDEVIDYCGVELFAISPYGMKDVVILKMKQKPFYKEHHLGWTSQAHFNVDREYDYPFVTSEIINNDDYKIIGRRGSAPTHLFENYHVRLTSYDPTIPYSGSFDLRVADTTLGDSYISDYDGYSSSQLTIPDYDNSNERISLGMLYTGYRERLSPTNYFFYFYDFATFYFKDACYYNAELQYMDDYYFSNFPNQILHRQITHTCQHCTTKSYIDTVAYMPSKENREKCPSRQGYDDSNHTYAPCEFEISTKVSFNYDGSLCVTIDGISNTDFPEDKMPFGYRIFHDFGDEETILFDPFIDNSEIIFPINFCIPECDLFYLKSIGRDSVSLSITFYDSTGRELNNPNCGNADFSFPLESNICDLIEINAVKTDSTAPCCTYEITITVDVGSCTTDNSILHLILERLAFKSFDTAIPINITTISGLDIDYDNGIVTFPYSTCDVDTIARLKLYFDGSELTCNSDYVDFSSCNCGCPPDSVKENWFNLTVTSGNPESPCGPDKCEVRGNIDIPIYYNCYNFYKINSGIGKSPIYSDGVIHDYSYAPLGCLEKGQSRIDTLYIYKTFTDPNPCVIIRPLFCNFDLVNEACTPDCDTVKWKKWNLDFALDSCPGCKVKVEYQTRENTCTGTQDIQITYFATYPENGDTTLLSACSLSADEVHKLVLKKAIFNNAMGFKPQTASDTGTCDDTWRVIQSSCWLDYSVGNNSGVVSNDGGPARVHRPCDSSECCSIGLRVCRFNNGPGTDEYITIDTIGGSGMPDSCVQEAKLINKGPVAVVYPPAFPGGQPSYGWADLIDTVECINTCGRLYGLTTEAYYGKIAMPEYQVESKENYGIDEVIIKMNQTNDYINFYIDSKNEINDLNLSVYSIHGINLINSKLKLRKGENNYTIPTIDLNTGFYIVGVQFNGVLLKTYKFIIIR